MAKRDFAIHLITLHNIPGIYANRHKKKKNEVADFVKINPQHRLQKPSSILLVSAVNVCEEFFFFFSHDSSEIIVICRFGAP